MLQRCARATVSGDTDTENNFLQLGLAHLDLHRNRLRVVIGVDKNIGRIKVAAGGQPLLRLHKLVQVVNISLIQACQTRHQHRVIAFDAADLHRPEPIKRAGVQAHGEAGGMRRGIHVGQAAGQFAGRVAARDQLTQGLGFCAAPGILGEAQASRQTPVLLDFSALRYRVGVWRVGNITQKINRHRADLCGLTGFNGHHDDGALIDTAFARDTDVGAEVAQRADQIADIAFGQHDQARQLGLVQIGDGAVALQLQVLFKHLFDF